jgi:hypothetical protein
MKEENARAKQGFAFHVAAYGFVNLGLFVA